MAFIRACLVATTMLFCMLHTEAQTIAFPAGSSELLRSTAEDMVALLKRANASFQVTSKEFNSIPDKGIVFIYDSTITNNGSCKVSGNGADQLVFRAAQDNGLVFGIYQYLGSLGYHFYLPGSIWEEIPSLNAVFKKVDTVYSIRYKYQSWFISGGHNRWVMDNNGSFSWDTYFGDNGHAWALYQRRNGMTGTYRFAGHRGDIMNANYLSTLQSNPCYIACYDGRRSASVASVPDVNNNDAMQLWSNAIANQYTQYRNTIFGNKTLYANQYRNFEYNNGNISIEVPDGAQWGNSTDNNICINNGYSSATDQHFKLSNFTDDQLAGIGKRTQVYAYASHANIPSAGIRKNMDVQVIPTAFQNETSARGLMNRWYRSGASVSEYHYLNIPQWGGETPMFYLSDMKATLNRIKQNNAQGIIWEASPAKFSSLPFLLAANNYLQNGTDIDNSLQKLCTLFGEASGDVFRLLQLWSDDKTVSTGDFIQDNKYKLPIYVQLLNEAGQKTKNSSALVKERMRELKAYLHYMVLYYDWLFDQRSHAEKATKAGQLCLYLAKINKSQLVNSYFLITDICSRYNSSSEFYRQYNPLNGTAYLNGNLPLITASEIDNNFNTDLAASSIIDQHDFKPATFIAGEFASNKLTPAKKISVKISYTNGAEYPNRSEFFMYVPSSGNLKLDYAPHFNFAGKGYINFTVESTDDPLNIIKDLSIDEKQSAGSFEISIPREGTYKLSVVSKYKSSVDVTINSNGIYFYKNGPFLGNKTENYRDDLAGFPGYFYVPAGIRRIYFSINNSNPGGSGFAKPEDISKTFIIKDNYGKTSTPRLVNPADSAFFFLDIPAGSDNSFWQVYKMEQYNLCFANISNLQWYAQKKETARAAAAVNSAVPPVIYPNPSSGVFNILQSHSLISAEEITVYNSGSGLVGTFKGVSQFSLSNLPAGLYSYKMRKNDTVYTGKLIKL